MPKPSTFVPIERDTMQESAYQQLREALMNGQLEPGQRVSIRSLANAMNTSPMPVREALRRLEAQRALVLCPGRTLAVPELTRAEFEEVRDLRATLEGMATERAATQASREQLHQIHRLCIEMQRLSERDEGTRYLEKNREFHFTIYRASGHEILLGMIETLWLRIGPFFNLYIKDETHILDSMEHHWKAVDALQQGHGADARAAIVADITEAANNLLDHVWQPDSRQDISA